MSNQKLFVWSNGSHSINNARIQSICRLHDGTGNTRHGGRLQKGCGSFACLGKETYSSSTIGFTGTRSGSTFVCNASDCTIATQNDGCFDSRYLFGQCLVVVQPFHLVHKQLIFGGVSWNGLWTRRTTGVWHCLWHQ